MQQGLTKHWGASIFLDLWSVDLVTVKCDLVTQTPQSLEGLTLITGQLTELVTTSQDEATP